jgi:hypothetical protein
MDAGLTLKQAADDLGVKLDWLVEQVLKGEIRIGPESQIIEREELDKINPPPDDALIPPLSRRKTLRRASASGDHPVPISDSGTHYQTARPAPRPGGGVSGPFAARAGIPLSGVIGPIPIHLGINLDWSVPAEEV